MRVATGTMGYKHRTLKPQIRAMGAEFLIKSFRTLMVLRACELVEYHLEDMKAAAPGGPGSLQLNLHALALALICRVPRSSGRLLCR
jgi:acetoacetate decarboxylase